MRTAPTLGLRPDHGALGINVQIAGQPPEIDCYAGRKADERPVRFRIGDRDYMVEEIIEQWYGPDDSFYRVRAGDDNLYLLHHHTSTGAWSIDPAQK